jgi:hypothetical protein
MHDIETVNFQQTYTKRNIREKVLKAIAAVNK